MVPAAFTVNDFIRKWRAVELKERSVAQEYFLLCRLLGEPSPAEADPTALSRQSLLLVTTCL
jgi:hypothetical protein